jgi:hypothetical protein
MILLVLGAQGVIRLLFDHDDAGVLQWLPGGFAAQLAGYVVIFIVGAMVAARGRKSLRRPNSGQ